MIDHLLALIVDESKWPAASLGLGLLAAALLLYRHRQSDISRRRRLQAAMNLCWGVTIGNMALGHLSAVTVKLGLNTIEGSVPVLYAIGVALAVPSWWLIYHTRRLIAADGHQGRTTLGLNAWLVVTLSALGVHNLPLAAPGVLNLGYQLLSGRWAGRAIAGIALLVNVGLFVGAVIFLARGQSFEQFRRIQ